AGLGLGLVRMEQRRHQIAEVFRDADAAQSTPPPPPRPPPPPPPPPPRPFPPPDSFVSGLHHNGSGGFRAVRHDGSGRQRWRYGTTWSARTG
ncbi:hypothetical protein ACH4OG_36315, partial [Streptomyces lydicus]